VGDQGIVELVHVMPQVQEDPFAVEGAEPYECWTRGQLLSLAERLAVPPGVTLKVATLRGRAARQVIDYARAVGADLLTTGTHGRGFVARAVLGSVATQLIRSASCAVLAVPRDPLPALEPAERTLAGSPVRPAASWIETLTTFSARNAGRRTILEVDDLELGAQAQEYNYPLLGTTYDERADRVELMLGDNHAGGRHLMRSIGNVTALDVLTDGKGRDIALRVQHGNSQTLLTFAA
jgi:nucleotide-binding universal stress UspA family protein